MNYMLRGKITKGAFFQLDKTLTIEGVGADAKATGDAIKVAEERVLSEIDTHKKDLSNPHKVTAEQVGARPNTWMPTAEQVGARPDTWMPTAQGVGARPDTWMPTASDVGAPTMEYTKKVGNPRNLLDNSDFRNPVNQRGVIHYLSSGYTIDRWGIWADNGNVGLSVIDGGVVFKGYLLQKLELDIYKTYTFAVMTGQGEVICVSGVPANFAQKASGNVTIQITIDASGLHTQVNLIQIDPSVNVHVKWAALYEGEYTAETLPEYQPKGYGAELAECQRYFYAISRAKFVAAGFGLAEAYAFYPVVNTPVPMRIRPTVVHSGNWVVWDGSSEITFTSLAVNAGGTAVTDCSQVSFQVDGAANLTAGKIYILTVRNDGQAYMWLSADL